MEPNVRVSQQGRTSRNTCSNEDIRPTSLTIMIIATELFAEDQLNGKQCLNGFMLTLKTCLLVNYTVAHEHVPTGQKHPHTVPNLLFPVELKMKRFAQCSRCSQPDKTPLKRNKQIFFGHKPHTQTHMFIIQLNQQ